MHSSRIVLVAIVSVMTAGIGWAQGPPAQSSVTAGWDDGFFIQSADGAHRLVLGATVQADGRFLFDDTQTVEDTFTIRKLRPTLSGRIAKYFDFRLMPDFGTGVATLQDAYLDIRFSEKFRVRTGKDKPPIGYELLLGDPYLPFPERSLASNLVPNRDVGVQAQGDLSPHFSYSGGVFHEQPHDVRNAILQDITKVAGIIGAAIKIAGNDFVRREVVNIIEPPAQRFQFFTLRHA